MLILRSSISADLKSETLKKGAFFTLSGGSLFLITAFLPFSFLSTYGLPFFLTSCFLIGQGLVPYRRLLLEEIHPNEIHLNDKELFFLQKKKLLFKLNKEDIDSIEFVENKKSYGIALQIKRPLNNQVTVFTSKGQFIRYLVRSKRLAEAGDLYLPFFTKHSYQELSLSLKEEPL
jgi:hypothetical protein